MKFHEDIFNGFQVTEWTQFCDRQTDGWMTRAKTMSPNPKGGRHNLPPLISKNTLIELGMLQIKEDGFFANQNDMCIPVEISDIHAVANKTCCRIGKLTCNHTFPF